MAGKPLRGSKMTTQAQIEADALNALRNEYEFQKGRSATAAAGIKWAIEQIERLTAAAEVGGEQCPQCGVPIAALDYSIHLERMDEKEAATIERCAQVVKDAADRHDSQLGCEPYTKAQLLEVYAAIRALKE